jgi:hypothetical protein
MSRVLGVWLRDLARLTAIKADTRKIGEPAVAKRMSPWPFHVPPRAVLERFVGSSVLVRPRPGFSWRRPCVKNARKRLSGDQNGNAASSLPGSARAMKLSI